MEIVHDITLLTKPAAPIAFLSENGIDNQEVLRISKVLQDTLEQHQDFLAISAPQLGINARIIALRFNDSIKIFINPIITKKMGSTVWPETYANVASTEYLVARPDEITVVYYNDKLVYEDNKLLGTAARLFDQQANILDGILPSDIGIPFEYTTGKAEDTLQAAFTEAAKILNDVNAAEDQKQMAKSFYDRFSTLYQEFLAKQLAATKATIEADEQASKVYKQLQFSEAVINGRTAVVADDIPATKLNRAQRRAIQFKHAGGKTFTHKSEIVKK